MKEQNSKTTTGGNFSITTSPEKINPYSVGWKIKSIKAQSLTRRKKQPQQDKPSRSGDIGMYQLSNCYRRIEGMMKNSPNLSLSSLYRNIRSDKRVSYIGDIPLTGELIIHALKSGVTYSRQQINRAMKQSTEFAGLDHQSKSEILDHFERLSNNFKERNEKGNNSHLRAGKGARDE